jgi:hypothetical protein
MSHTVGFHFVAFLQWQALRVFSALITWFLCLYLFIRCHLWGQYHLSQVTPSTDWEWRKEGGRDRKQMTLGDFAAMEWSSILVEVVLTQSKVWKWQTAMHMLSATVDYLKVSSLRSWERGTQDLSVLSLQLWSVIT